MFTLQKHLHVRVDAGIAADSQIGWRSAFNVHRLPPQRCVPNLDVRLKNVIERTRFGSRDEIQVLVNM